MKIRTQITLPIMLTAIVVLSAASIYSYNFTNNILETEAVKKLEATAQLTKRYISSVLEEQKEKVEIAATHDELSIEELQEILDINPEFYEVFVVDSEGMIISSTNQSHVGSDRSKDTYFTNARNKTYIKPVYYSEFVQKDAITVSTPHADGVLVARIELEFFNSIVADKTGLGQTGESLLAYQNKEEEFVFFTEKRFEEGPHGHEATHVVLPIEEALSGNEDVFFEFDYRHIPVIAVTRYLEEANIGLVVKIDQAEAFAPSRQVLNLSIVRILLVLFIFFVIIYFLAKTISKPIEALHRGTEVIKQGNLDHKVGTNVQDEVGQLSRSFDDMVASLKKSRADIDKKVKQQTKDIVSKSKELENQQAAVLNILEDVEEEKEKTVILAKDLEKFKLAVDNASDHIVITDQDGICLYANQAVETITGYTAKEIMGQKAGIKKLWSGNMAEDFYEKLWKTITEDKKSFIGDIANTRKNGEDYDAVTSISPILDDDGEVKFIVAVERDVTKE
ncbi:MAG: PAS domain S-box protein, partial [Candidatus Komeilibacteria bacterium]|nr:PAS domain S-box protein [Candidatus Komeilibacteria bacterium]